MNRKEHLLLKKTFTEFLEKDFIYINNSFTIVLILFIHKPERGMRFYINYHNLNYLSIKNHYLLSLIREILRNIAIIK